MGFRGAFSPGKSHWDQELKDLSASPVSTTLTAVRLHRFQALCPPLIHFFPDESYINKMIHVKALAGRESTMIVAHQRPTLRLRDELMTRRFPWENKSPGNHAAACNANICPLYFSSFLSVLLDPRGKATCACWPAVWTLLAGLDCAHCGCDFIAP